MLLGQVVRLIPFPGVHAVGHAPAPDVAAGQGSETWTAIGTVALAALTLATLVYTIITTARERRQAGADRIAADNRLKEEREAGDRRLREERDHAEAVRRRERQIDCARGLLERIAFLMPNMGAVPRLPYPIFVMPGAEPGRTECRDAVGALRHGLHTDAAAIGHAGAAGQYRTLVRLVEAVAHRPFKQASADDLDLMAAELRRYAVFVRLSLERFIDCGDVWDPGTPQFPDPERTPGGTSLWAPEVEPDGWREALQLERDDPLYVPPT